MFVLTFGSISDRPGPGGLSQAPFPTIMMASFWCKAGRLAEAGPAKTASGPIRDDPRAGLTAAAPSPRAFGGQLELASGFLGCQWGPPSRGPLTGRERPPCLTSGRAAPGRYSESRCARARGIPPLSH